MIEALAQTLWQAGGVLACGSGLFLWRAGPIPAALQAWQARAWRLLAAACALACVAGGVLLYGEATRILGRAPAWQEPAWGRLLGDTRLGQVWCLKQALLLVLAAGLATAPRRAAPFASLLGAIFLALGPWAGHGGAGTPLLPAFAVFVLHALLAGAWLGALPAWGLLLAAGEAACAEGFLGRAVGRFSRFASVAMVVLLASGATLAWHQFGTWPALFGTPPGALLAAKLGLVALALAAAWRLRRDHLAALVRAPTAAVRVAALRVFVVEALAAGGVFIVALALARAVPGAHQAITWWLPLRFAPGAPFVPGGAWLEAALGLGLAGCALPLAWGRQARAAVLVALAGFVLFLAAGAVPAGRDTYLRSAQAYTAPSIARGAALYRAECEHCHGAGGRGAERPLGPDLAAPADLARHAGLHTAGDMYQWVSAGMGRGMPAFAARLDSAARWDLVNFLRAFADGYAARILAPAPEARRPWLTAPNFAWQTAAGDSVELKDSRGRASVLLVFADATARARLAALAVARDTLRAAGVTVLVVPGEGGCATHAPAGLDCVAGGASTVTQSFALFARTLARPGPRDALAPGFARGEFLVDPRGYLRARWLPADDGEPWPVASLVALARAFAAEPPTRPAPDDHVH